MLRVAPLFDEVTFAAEIGEIQKTKHQSEIKVAVEEDAETSKQFKKCKQIYLKLFFAKSKVKSKCMYLFFKV